MTHLSTDPRGRSLELVLRDAREARDRELAALLAGAATGLANAAAAAMRGLGQAVRRIVSGVISDQRRRAAIRQLQALDDLLLKDIGISRSDIPFVVERQLTVRRATPAEAGKSGEIAAFPDRQAAAASPRVLLRPAA
jgi:uncharacterized protein YjiS (DUF1127 family)